MKKNIEWLKKEVPNLRGYAVVIDEIDGGLNPVTTISLKDVYRLINQLDEPDSDYAYQKGFREGERQTAEYFESVTEEPSYAQVQKYLSEHGIEVVDKEPETVASVIADFYKSLERLKEVLRTEVEEMEE